MQVISILNIVFVGHFARTSVAVVEIAVAA
jgi:hypothetical protein